MLTNVQRNLAAVKLELLREANGVPQQYVDQLNVAIAHINDAAQIIQGVCAQVEPQIASMDTERLAERQELEHLRAQVRERDEQRKQPDVEPGTVIEYDPAEGTPSYEDDEFRSRIGEQPASPFLNPGPDTPLDPDATTNAPPKDLIPIVDPESATSPIRDPAEAAAEQARSSGRQADTEARQSDPAEQGWG